MFPSQSLFGPFRDHTSDKVTVECRSWRKLFWAFFLPHLFSPTSLAGGMDADLCGKRYLKMLKAT